MTLRPRIAAKWLRLTSGLAALIAVMPAGAAEPTPLAPDAALDICFAPSFADAIAAAAKLGWDAMPPRAVLPYRIGLLVHATGNPQDQVPGDAEPSDVVRAAGWRASGATPESEIVLVEAKYGVAAGLICYLTESTQRNDLEPALVARLGAEPFLRGKAGKATSLFWNGQGVAAVLLSYDGAEGDTSYLSISRGKPGP